MRAQAQQATITHAVIGTQETIDFGISNDPAFFQILSSSLYKNQVLAVVRETMCNAHDAHIAGNVKKPVQVNIDHEQCFISFRDFGPGIAHNLIGPIYGVYGASTKKNDNRQTGAFGLGCKSPFAYVEHFEVTSWHQGVKSIYNMSRSSAAKDGTPGITRLLNVPTDETGLQVRFKVDPEDINRFMAYVQRVAFLGSIPTYLNGQSLPMAFLGQTPGHWTLISTSNLCESYPANNIFVRYGSVVYPMDKHPEYKDPYNTISHFINRNTQHQALLIQAVPDSLVVMPNRESLSMQDQTVNSLKLLCEEFLKKNLNSAWRHELLEAGKAVLDSKENTLGKLLTYGRLLGKDRGYYEDDRGTTVKLSSPQEDPLEAIARYNVMRSFKENHMGITKPLTLHRKRILEAHPEVSRGLVQTYFKMRLSKSRANHRIRQNISYSYDADKTNLHDWYLRYVIKPVAKKLNAAGYPTKSNLLMYGKIPAEHTSQRGRSRYRRSSVGFASIHKTLSMTLDESNLLVPCIKRVVLTTSMKLLQQNESIIFNTFLPHMDFMGLLAYVLPTKKNQQEEVRKLFQELGYTVIDLSVDSDWKEEDKKPAAEPKPKKPVIEGRRSLLSYYKGNVLDKSKLEQDVNDRLTQPEFYAYLIRNRLMHHEPATIENLGSPKLPLVASIASLGVGVETANSIPLLRKQGIPCMAEYVVTNLHNHILTSQTLKDALAYDLVGYTEKTKGDAFSIHKIVMRIPELRDHLNLIDNTTDDDKLALRWWRYLKTHHTTRYHGVKSLDDRIKFLDCMEHSYLQEIETYLLNIKIDPAVENAAKIISASKLIDFLDLPAIESRLLSKTDPMDPADKQHLIEMLLSALSV